MPQPSQSQWACTACSLLNSNRRRLCEVCGTRRCETRSSSITPTRASKKARSEGSTSKKEDVPASSPSLPPAVAAAPLAAVSLFQTGSGRAVAVSQAGRNFAQSFLGDDDDDDVPLLPASPAVVTDKQPLHKNTPSAADRGVSTGSSCPTPAAALAHSQNPVEARLSRPAVSAAPADPVGNSCATLFQWGNGQGVKVLKANVEQAKSRFKLLSSSDDDDDDDDDASPAKAPPVAAPAPPISLTASLHNPSRISGLMKGATQEPASATLSSDFATPARNTFGTRKPFTAPRLVATTTKLHATARPSTAAMAAPAAISTVNQIQGTNVKLVKLALDLNQLEGGSLPPLDLNPTDLSGHTFPLSACSPALLSLFGISERTPGLRIRSEHFHRALLTLGAVPAGCSLDWIENHVKLVKFKLFSHTMFYSSSSEGAAAYLDTTPVGIHHFTPLHVLVQLCYRYNTEYVDGRRSILRRICEKDSPVGTSMVLYVQAVRTAPAAPHAVAVDLSDGWYAVTTLLDVPLSQLLKDSVIVVGQKIIVSGATSRYETAASPLEIPSGTPILSVGRNGVSLANAAARLGVLQHSSLPAVLLQHIHPQGGAVPAVDAYISRVLQPYFVQTISDGSDSAKKFGDSGGSKNATRLQSRIIRNAAAQSKFNDEFERKREAAYEKAIETMSRDEAAELMKERFAVEISQVLTMIVENGCGEVAAVQYFSRQGNCGGDDVDLPKEGSRVRFFNLTPCRFERCGPPLSCKLLYAQRQLCFIPLENSVTEPQPSLMLKREVYSAFSQIVDASRPSKLTLPDLCVVCVGSKVLDAKHVVLLVVGSESNVFGLIDVFTTTGVKELLFPLPPEGACCIVQCVRFLSHDSDLEHNVYRFDASEYTSISQRSRFHEAALAQLERTRPSWRSTFELGKKILQDDEMIRRWGSRQVGSASGAVAFEGSAQHVATTITPGSFRGPHYLQQHSSQSTRSSLGVANALEKSNRTVMDNSASHRVLFEPSPIQPPIEPECLRSINTSQQSADSPCHLFCNFIPLSGRLQLMYGQKVVASYDLLVDEPANIIRSEGNITSNNAITAGSVDSQLVFQADGGPCQRVHHVAFAGLALESLFTSVAGTLHSLLSVCVDEDHFLLSVSRGKVLSVFETEAEKWHRLLSNSVVVPKSLLDKKKQELQEECSATPYNDGSSSDPHKKRSAKSSEVDADQLAGLPRWNDGFVDAVSVLWWSDSEWQMVQELLLSGLQDKLFKLTLKPDPSLPVALVEKIYFIKDKCPIGTLYS